MDFLAFNLQELPYVIIVLLIAFTVHEFSHAYVAYRFRNRQQRNKAELP